MADSAYKYNGSHENVEKVAGNADYVYGSHEKVAGGANEYKYTGSHEKVVGDYAYSARDKIGSHEKVVGDSAYSAKDKYVNSVYDEIGSHEKVAGGAKYNANDKYVNSANNKYSGSHVFTDYVNSADVGNNKYSYSAGNEPSDENKEYVDSADAGNKYSYSASDKYVNSANGGGKRRLRKRWNFAELDEEDQENERSGGNKEDAENKYEDSIDINNYLDSADYGNDKYAHTATCGGNKEYSYYAVDNYTSYGGNKEDAEDTEGEDNIINVRSGNYADYADYENKEYLDYADDYADDDYLYRKQVKELRENKAVFKAEEIGNYKKPARGKKNTRTVKGGKKGERKPREKKGRKKQVRVKIHCDTCKHSYRSDSFNRHLETNKHKLTAGGK